MHSACCLIKLAERSLSVFQPILFECCSFHVAVLQCSLVWSPPRISWRNNILQPFGEVIHLQVELRHSIHIGSLLWVRILHPHHIWLFRLHVCQSAFFVPISFNRKSDLLLLATVLKTLTLEFERLLWEPTPPFEPDLTPFIRSLLIHDSQCVANVNIQVAYHKVVSWNDRLCDFVLFVEFIKVHIDFVLVCNF